MSSTWRVSLSKSPLRFKSSESEIPVSDLEQIAQGWLLDGEARQLSPQTLFARRFIVEKLLWFLRQQQAVTCSAGELRAFLAYVGRRDVDAGGRWGNPQQKKPVRPRTVHTYHGNLRTLFRFAVYEGMIEAS